MSALRSLARNVAKNNARRKFKRICSKDRGNSSWFSDYWRDYVKYKK